MNLFEAENRFSLGITGTRNGMRPKQMQTVRSIVGFLLPDEANHGNCVGADAEFHDIIRELTRAVIVVHPPTNKDHVADKQGDFILPARKYMERNETIVNASVLMLATPFEYNERGRGSGTWAAIRYTRKVRKPLIIIWPDGTFTPEGDLQKLPNCVRMINDLKQFVRD